MPGDCFTEDILIYQALQIEKPNTGHEKLIARPLLIHTLFL